MNGFSQANMLYLKGNTIKIIEMIITVEDSMFKRLGKPSKDHARLTFERDISPSNDYIENDYNAINAEYLLGQKSLSLPIH